MEIIAQSFTLLHGGKDCAFRWLRDIIHKGKFFNGHFVGGTSIYRAIFLLLLVLTGLNTSHDVDVLSHTQRTCKTCRTSPNDTRNVVAFVVGAIYRQQDVANVAIEGSCAVHRRFADAVSYTHLTLPTICSV